jgi:hypothetical protein
MSEENVEAIRELFDRFGEIEFGQLRKALETSSSLPEAASKLADLGRWQLDRLHPQIELDASAMRRSRRETGPRAIKAGSSSGEAG